MSDGSSDERDSCDDLSPNNSQRETKSKRSNYRRIDFSVEDEEKLIELVKTFPSIYNVSSSEYKDRFLRHKNWQTISENLSKSVEQCKKKWKNIKDQYDRTKKKMPTGSGASENQSKRSELMSFLDSYSTVNKK